MTSERKIAAARANGAKSRGAKTEAGRRRSSQNSRKHGLYSRTPPDPSDIPAELASQFAGYWTELQPQSPRAIAALQAKIDAELQLFLLQRTETALWSAEYNRLAALHPDVNRGALYYEAFECTPALLIFRCYNRHHRRKRRAEAILRDENEILKQRTEIAPPAVPDENAKMSERTNQIPRRPRHAHRPTPKARPINPIPKQRTNQIHRSNGHRPLGHEPRSPLEFLHLLDTRITSALGEQRSRWASHARLQNLILHERTNRRGP